MAAGSPAGAASVGTAAAGMGRADIAGAHAASDPRQGDTFMKKIISFIGARPQFIKEALLGRRARELKAWNHVLVHSGQHYDLCMSDIFFQELGIPQPDHHLGIGSGSHAAMTAQSMLALESVLLQEKPDALLLYGDTNTTLAGALVACKMDIPVIHVEAGIRMQPENMPEEINRRLVDRVSAVLCCCSGIARKNLEHEGITRGVSVTGDIMYDIFLQMQPLFSSSDILEKMGVTKGGYIVVTLHRNYNVDCKEHLEAVLAGLESIALSGLEVLFPVHPRTKKRMQEFALETQAQHVRFLAPAGYLELMALVENAAFVITDSGGLQKESYYAGKRSIVIMPDSGWRELVETGWNILCSPDAQKLKDTALMLDPTISPPPAVYGSGNAAEAIIEAVKATLW